MTPHPAVAATCTTAGNVAYWHCSVCNKYFSDANGQTEIAENSWIIAASGHSLTPHPAVAATCTTAGNVAYWHCSVCNKYFSDANGQTEIALSSTVIGALGHDFVKDGTIAPDLATQTDGYDLYICSRCDETERRNYVDWETLQTHTITANDASIDLTTYVLGTNLPVPQKNGYSFDGWYTTSDFSGEAITSLDNLDSDIVLYAKWSAIEPVDDGLGAGAIAGIVIGSVSFAAITGFAVFWFVIKKKKFADLIALFRK